MTIDARSLDLQTINVAVEVVSKALRAQALNWEIQSANAAFCGQLNEALTCEHWAFAANILAGTASGELTRLFIQAIDAQMNAPAAKPEPVRSVATVGELPQVGAA